MTHGIIFGQFAPFHLGHAFFIEQAMARCARLSVFVCGSAESYPDWLRYHWVKTAFPELDVRHLPNARIADAQSLVKHLPQGAGILFESGERQKTLAQQLGLQHQSIDPERLHYPVKTSEIRQNPHRHWDLLPPNTRAHFVKRIALLGPESCGKSWLAEHLARHFDTVFAEEYGRTYCEKFGMDSTELDFAHVAGGQLYREDEMASQANHVLFCDTELIVTQVWSEVYFQGKCQPWIFWANHLRRYDLFLLCAPDIPWQNDGLRQFEQQREWMFERLKQEMECRALPYQLIHGDFTTRTARAIAAVEQFLAK